MENKKISIGISDFKKLRESDCYFIDKSLFIKDVVNGSEILLYPRPRRFGKTINLSMLRYFYDNSEDNSALFKDLAITKENEIMQKQGKYPVIFITFKDIKSDSYEHCISSIYDLIAKVFDEYKYIQNADFMSKFNTNFFNKIINKTGDLAEFENSFKYLCEYLYLYHKVNPVILIDEYDMPIQSAYINGFYDRLIIFIRNLLSGCLKDNSFLEKAVLTGILRVAKESIFSGLNNLDVCSILQPYSVDKFGFTEKEVEKCLSDYSLSDRLSEIKEWYDGYNFFGVEIYNPWSILSFLNKKTFSPYWVNTSGNELIKSLLQKANPDVKKDLEILIDKASVKKAVQDNIVYADINQSDNALWNFLLMSGYLRYDNLKKDEFTLLDYAELSIPNTEVLYLFLNDVIRNWFIPNSGEIQLNNILQNLTTGDLDIFRKTFTDFCLNSFSYYDVSGEQPEKFYHAFVLGLIISLRDKYIIKSNRESGYGRYDIMLIPKELNHRGIIFEFKKLDQHDKENFAEAVKAAKKQITEKKYASELQALGVNNIINVVAVFDKKEVKVEWYADGNNK